MRLQMRIRHGEHGVVNAILARPAQHEADDVIGLDRAPLSGLRSIDAVCVELVEFNTFCKRSVTCAHGA